MHCTYQLDFFFSFSIHFLCLQFLYTCLMKFSAVVHLLRKEAQSELPHSQSVMLQLSAVRVKKADFLLRTTLVFSSGNVNLLCIFILSCKITRATCYNIIFNTRRKVYGEVFCVLPVLMVRLWSSLQLCGNNNDNIISNILCNLLRTNLLQVLRKTRRHHETLSGKTRKFKFVRAARYNFFLTL